MNTDTTTQQNKKNIERCTHHLKTIGKAIQSYHEEHGDYPDWLGDLVPKHLDDANILICPDNSGSSPFECYLEAYGDCPKLLSDAISAVKRNKIIKDVSYSYQLEPGYRHLAMESKLIYGDVVPIVKCWHHRSNGDYDYLNLSFGNKVYKSSIFWYDSLEDVYGSLEAAIDALESGFQRIPDQESNLMIYTQLVDLYVKTRREKDAEKLIDRFKKIIELTESNSYYLEDMLKAMDRDDELLAFYDELEKQHPKNRTVLKRIARFHKERGNTELELEYRKKYIPGLKYLGKMVPDFSSTDIDGKPISLEAYRGKVVLLDFWATWSERLFFRETINKKRLYKAYKDKGFDILGINIDYDVIELRDYLEKSGIPWRQVCNGKKWECPVAQQYQIYGLPTMWLIDKDGKLISHQTRGNALNRLVAEALKEASS